jgi:AcrR family transcriptional regulator
VSDNFQLVTVTATVRKTAEERREKILDAALTEFAQHGYEGASTDRIARAVGISQPYLFRLFGTKKGLYLASAERCLSDTYETFRVASEGMIGDEALEGMGKAYKQMIAEDPRRLAGQMQAYSACDDPDIREVVQTGFGRLVELVESKGVSGERVVQFFAFGMLINVMTQVGIYDLDRPWAKRLVENCMKGK